MWSGCLCVGYDGSAPFESEHPYAQHPTPASAAYTDRACNKWLSPKREAPINHAVLVYGKDLRADWSGSSANWPLHCISAAAGGLCFAAMMTESADGTCVCACEETAGRKKGVMVG